MNILFTAMIAIMQIWHKLWQLMSMPLGTFPIGQKGSYNGGIISLSAGTFPNLGGSTWRPAQKGSALRCWQQIMSSNWLKLESNYSTNGSNELVYALLLLKDWSFEISTWILNLRNWMSYTCFLYWNNLHIVIHFYIV